MQSPHRRRLSPIRLGDSQIGFERTLVMGIVNVTPDSFSDGGAFFDPRDAVDHATRLADEGADFIDIGGESTRPGASPVGAGQEIERVVPVIEAIAGELDVFISIDTYKADVAEAALDAGAHLVNDISGMRFDPRMVELLADRGVPVVLMHILGTPDTMQETIEYEDVVDDIIEYFEERIETAVKAGIDENQLLVDPGIGFGKTAAHNFEILRRLDEFRRLGRPLLLGTSRKSFIGTVTGRPAPARVFGTAATVAAGVLAGANVVRVHDVAQMLDVTRVSDAIRRFPPPEAG